jgi:hypothetical protein
MICYTKQEAVAVFLGCGKPVPKWVDAAPRDAKFAMGFTLAGHLPFHRVGTSPRVMRGCVSIDPTFGIEP